MYNLTRVRNLAYVVIALPQRLPIGRSFCLHGRTSFPASSRPAEMMWSLRPSL